MKESPFTPSDKQINDALNRSRSRAEEYLHDYRQIKTLLEEAVKKANQHKDARIPQTDFWSHLKAFFRLLKSYTRINTRSFPGGQS
jgi:ribulose bisphosphate carboxylase small subunit